MKVEDEKIKSNGFGEKFKEFTSKTSSTFVMKSDKGSLSNNKYLGNFQ